MSFVASLFKVLKAANNTILDAKVVEKIAFDVTMIPGDTKEVSKVVVVAIPVEKQINFKDQEVTIDADGNFYAKSFYGNSFLFNVTMTRPMVESDISI